MKCQVDFILNVMALLTSSFLIYTRARLTLILVGGGCYRPDEKAFNDFVLNIFSIKSINTLICSVELNQL